MQNKKDDKETYMVENIDLYIQQKFMDIRYMDRENFGTTGKTEDKTQGILF